MSTSKEKSGLDVPTVVLLTVFGLLILALYSTRLYAGGFNAGRNDACEWIVGKGSEFVENKCTK